MNLVHCFGGKDFMTALRIIHMTFDIFLRLCPIQIQKYTIHIDPLADCRVQLKFQFVSPQFYLSYKYEGHATYRTEPIVQKETKFLQSFFFQQVRLIQNAYHLFMLATVYALDLLLAPMFGIAMVERASNLS